MASIKPSTTIKGYQKFVNNVYGLSNDRYFSLWDMLTNVERFVMRGLKGIRKNDKNKTKYNLSIALSWFMSIMNQLRIDIEDNVWRRFPYLCSYCGSCPCRCKEKKVKKRMKIKINEKTRPNSLAAFQKMFNEIYPANERTLEHAGVHLAEEVGELAESILTYRGGHSDEDFKNVELESADFFSCIMGVFNSLDINIAKELSKMFKNNCHMCKKAPCECNFKDITTFKS
jgi:NTP pyrophosphatase (non-canonical NTP hydrolase)